MEEQRLTRTLIAVSLGFIAVVLLLSAVWAGSAADLTATLSGPEFLFRDQSFSGVVEVTNTGRTDHPGAIYIRQTGRKPFSKILDSRFAGKAGETVKYQVAIPYLDFGVVGGKLEVFYRDPELADTVLATQPLSITYQRTPKPGENILANGSFELSNRFCGSALGKNDADMQWGNPSWWKVLPIDGWWAEGSKTTGIGTSADGMTGKYLCIDATKAPVIVASSFGRYVPAGQVTLSAYVKTKDAAGDLYLQMVPDINFARQRLGQASRTVAIPANSDWTRIVVTLDNPVTNSAMVRISVDKGVVLVDDVKVELGDKPTSFNVRPEEYLRLSFGSDAMPKWVTTGSQNRTVTVTNDSRIPLKGVVTLQFGPWNIPDQFAIATFDAASLPAGKSRTFTFSTKNLRVDGYVVSCNLQNNATVIHDGLWDFDPYAFTAYDLGNMLHSRSVARFALLRHIDPKNLFGIGNSTQQKWSLGLDKPLIEYFLEMKEIGLTSIRAGSDDNQTFMCAVAGGLPVYTTEQYDDAPAGFPNTNPCSPGRLDVYSEEGHRRLVERGESVGKDFASNPTVMGVQLANEQFWANGPIPCPTKAADDNFRTWCKTQHGDLQTLNQRWGTSYTSWDQVNQAISEPFYKELVAKTVKAGGSLDWGWMNWSQSWPKEAVEELDRLPGKTMDWLRWRSITGVEAYMTFINAAKKYDKKTLYGTDLPIDTFVKQFVIPYIRATDAAMINVRYTSGYPVSFGTPHECMSSLEMCESVADGKPFWGIEVYAKATWPAESTALQNWGLIAHGMNVPHIFSWYPMTDTGTPTKVLEWEDRLKKGGDMFNYASWYMIDVDGARLPIFDPYVRSLNEVKEFNQNYNGVALRRVKTDVAYYVANDTSEHSTFITKYAPWGAVTERVCFNLIYFLRICGITADFIDDANFPDKPGRYQKIIVPMARVLSQSAAAKLAAFAKSGGTVVLVGMPGQLDPWLRKYDNIGGPAWSELAWKAPNYDEQFHPYIFDPNTNISTAPAVSATDKAGTPDEKRDDSVSEAVVFRGSGFGEIAGAQAIKDLKGQTVGWTRAWGSGKLVAYGICPDTWTTDPHLTPNTQAWMRQMIGLASIKPTATWTTTSAASSDGVKVGTGTPVVDLVVREKSPKEKFIFALNQGGEGEGIVEIPVPSGNWQSQDAIDPTQPIAGSMKNGTWQVKLALKPLGYRVIRLWK